MVETMRCFGEGCVFKIDFEKIYDCLNWHFLAFVLNKMDLVDPKVCVVC